MVQVQERFKIAGSDRTYSIASIDELSLRDMLVLKAELNELGIRETWQQIEAAAAEMSAPDAPDDHPLAILLFSISVWAARRKAGDELSFADSIDVPLTSITWIPVPGDRQGKAKGGAKKATRKGSGPVSAPDTTTGNPSTSTD